jgi:hypothetical protein
MVTVNLGYGACLPSESMVRKLRLLGFEGMSPGQSTIVEQYWIVPEGTTESLRASPSSRFVGTGLQLELLRRHKQAMIIFVKSTTGTIPLDARCLSRHLCLRGLLFCSYFVLHG